MTDHLWRVLDVIDAAKRARDLAAVVVHLNDTYYVKARGNAPGVLNLKPFVDQIRARARATGTSKEDRTLVVHSGDFLMPSPEGVKDKGVAMAQALGSFVDVVALGNHEFDVGRESLAARLRELTHGTRDTKVVCTNVHLPGELGKHVRRDYRWPEDEPILRVIGVMGRGLAPVKKWGLREERAEVAVRGAANEPLRLVILSHALNAEDERLAATVAKVRDDRAPVTYLLGGHDHDVDWSSRNGRVVRSKCLSNGRSLRVFVLTWSQLALDIVRPFRTTKSARAQRSWETALARVRALRPHSSEWTSELTSRVRSPDALETFLSQKPPPADVGIRVRTGTLVPDAARLSGSAKRRPRWSPKIPGQSVDVTDEATRGRPTAFGTFVAECCKAGMRADCALIHAGSFRGDDVYATPLPTSLLDLVFIYDRVESADGIRSVLCAQMPSTLLRTLLRHGRLKGRASGAYPQVSLGIDQVVRERRSVRVAITSYLLLDAMDGYRQHVVKHYGRRADRTIQSWAAGGSSTITDLVTKFGTRVPWPSHLASPPAALPPPEFAELLGVALEELQLLAAKDSGLDAEKLVSGQFAAVTHRSARAWRESSIYESRPSALRIGTPRLTDASRALLHWCTTHVDSGDGSRTLYDWHATLYPDRQSGNHVLSRNVVEALHRALGEPGRLPARHDVGR